MNPLSRKKHKRRSLQVMKENDKRFQGLYKCLVEINVLNDVKAFHTKKYGSKDYFSVFEQASLHKRSIKQVSLMGRASGKRFPSPEQIMKCCRKNSSSKMTELINITLSRQFYALPRPLQQKLKKSGIVIIDFHQDPYYGKLDNPAVNKSKTKRSTAYFYEYLTVCVYCPKGSFNLAVVHRDPQKRIFSLLFALFGHIEKILRPKIVLFDGEFALLEFLKLLMNKNVRFLVRKSKTQRVKAHVTQHYSQKDWLFRRKWRPIELRSKRYRVKTISVDTCPQLIKGEMKMLIKSPGWNITPQYADKLYRGRFNIEKSYRDAHPFHIFTCTKVLGTRLLFFFSQCYCGIVGICTCYG